MIIVIILTCFFTIYYNSIIHSCIKFNFFPYSFSIDFCIHNSNVFKLNSLLCMCSRVYFRLIRNNIFCCYRRFKRNNETLLPRCITCNCCYFILTATNYISASIFNYHTFRNKLHPSIWKCICNRCVSR